MFEGGPGESVPQALKPRFLAGVDGPVETRPFPFVRKVMG